MSMVRVIGGPMPKSQAGYLADLLSELGHPQALAVALSEAREIPDAWEVEAYYDGDPLKNGLSDVLVEHGFAADVLRDVPLPDVDWVKEGLKALAPVRAGRFWLHGAHDRGLCPAGSVSIEIEASVAFGTGHHETTRGCLLALEEISRRMRPRSVLDVGTGTGVLAIAAAMMWHVPVMASDIDPVAVRMAERNVRINRAGGQVRLVVAPGVRHPRIRRGRPYDVIFANILAGPLRRMAGDLAENLSSSGVLVLSGLLREQENCVMARFRSRGLALAKRIGIGPWSTLLLRRG